MNKKTKRKLSIFYSNINGYQSKSLSLKEIINDINPEIIVISETKLGKNNTVKYDLKKYDLISKQIKKGKGGILCAVKQNIGASSVLEVTTVKNDNILSVKISFPSCSIRVVVAYGPQENEPIEVKEEFFKDVEIEVKASKVNGDNCVIVGDLNSKIELKNDKVQYLSNNGKYLAELILKCNLKVLNFSPECTGKWTHVIRTSDKKSVIDYIIGDEGFYNKATNTLIDEECLCTPFRAIHDKKGTRAQYTDHNTLICNFEIERGKQKKEKLSISESWIFNDAGWDKFNQVTSSIPCLIRESNETNVAYEKLETYIKYALDCSFKKRVNRDKKSETFSSKDEKQVYSILRMYMKLGKVQRKVAGYYINDIKKCNLARVSEVRCQKVKDALTELTYNENFSQCAFWKIKKKLNLKTEVGTSVVLKSGVEVFGEGAIIEAYKTEFNHRLRKREICDHLANYEKLSNSLCNRYVQTAKETQSRMGFHTNKLKNTIKTLKKNKAPGPDGIPAEVFIHAGPKLIQAVISMFMNIEINGYVPDKWNKVHIKTLYKHKGSHKELENYRGVFLTPAITKLCEKYIMMESKNEIENINKFQAGSRPNRSAADQLFLLRAVMDHAKYINKVIFITLYDFTQCFDGMWLEDSLLSLTKIGIGCERISLIKELNKTADIVVKTPVGNTDEFTVRNIVKQGTVLGPLLCSASTAECCEEHTEGGVSVGSCAIRSLAYVDDILDVTEGEEDANIAHNTVIHFAKKKRLEISWKKCAILSVNSKKIPKLMVNGKPIKAEKSVKYLGDIINNKGTYCDLVEDRVKKGNGCAVSIISIVQQVTFGVRTMEATLLLYNSIFLSTILYNAQSWSYLNKTEMNRLRGCQLSFLKRILHAPKSAPTAIVFAELGILPVEFEIYTKKLMFLQHIMKLDKSDPVRKMYNEQLKYPSEMNWAMEVKRIKEQMNITIDDEDISAMTKMKWKTQVDKAVKESALKKLNSDCNRLKIVSRQYNKLTTKEYLVKLPVDDARLAFSYRCGTLDIKCNRQYMYSDRVCRACGKNDETLNHIVNICQQQDPNLYDILDTESNSVTVIKDIVEKIKTHSTKAGD